MSGVDEAEISIMHTKVHDVMHDLDAAVASAGASDVDGALARYENAVVALEAAR